MIHAFCLLFNLSKRYETDTLKYDYLTFCPTFFYVFCNGVCDRYIDLIFNTLKIRMFMT